jgi:hypothetical protein
MMAVTVATPCGVRDVMMRSTLCLGDSEALDEETREALCRPRACGFCGTSFVVPQPLPRTLEMTHTPIIEPNDGQYQLGMESFAYGCEISADSVTIHRCRYGTDLTWTLEIG